MQNEQTLPQDLGDGLLLRWATPADAEAIVAFNINIHSDDVENAPELWLGEWTRALMSGDHPTTQASDFTVVLADGRVVSTACLINQRWAYEGIALGCGRPELIGTDPAYRRRGLIRRQMAALHAKSAARGDLMQVITGIPWYYRQFGYEMTLELHGSRPFFLSHHPVNKAAAIEPFRLRPATPSDLPQLQALYEAQRRKGVVSVVRPAEEWHYAAFVVNRESPYALNLWLVEAAAGEVVGYLDCKQWDEQFSVRDFVVAPSTNLRDVALFVTRALGREAEQRNASRHKPIDRISFGLGGSHPLYEALGNQLGTGQPPYAWYVRVGDVAAFLRHVAPAFAPRLANSVLAGYTGTLRLSFYRYFLQLTFADGKLGEVATYTPSDFFDCDAFFPEQTFLHLLLGHRSLAEVRYLWPDCYTRQDETAVLLNALFPKRPSYVRALG